MRLLLLGIALAAAPTVGVSAPPPLISLFPAGAERGKTLDVSAGGTFSSWPVQCWISGTGVTAVAGKEKGSISIKVAPDAEAGVRWLRLFNDEGTSPLRPFIVGSLPELTEREPNDEYAKPQSATLPIVVNGRLAKNGDMDHFGVDLKKGQILVASLLANQTLQSPMDGILEIVSADGLVLASENDTIGLDPRLAFTAPRDGKYIIRVCAFPAVPDSGIRFAGGDTFIYRLTLTAGLFADHAFPSAIQCKQLAAVDRVGWNIPDPDRSVKVELKEPTDRHWIAHGEANPIAIRVEPHPSIIEVEPNPSAKPQIVNLPATISGRIDKPGDVDSFQFAAKKGQRVVLQVEAQQHGSALDPTLRVVDSAGKALVEIDDAGKDPDPSTTFTVPNDGNYRVEVRDLFQHGDWRHWYRLRAFFPLPEFSLAVATDQFTVTVGQPLEIPVTVDRQNGLVEIIQLQVEGLPEGVVTAFDPPTADAKTKSVKLKLTATKGEASVAFRIAGSAQSLESPRLAKAALPALKESTTALWLTVRKAPAKK